MPSHPSPLRYPGGKHSLAPLLAGIMVCNDLHDGVLVEPFAGGAGAALRLMFDEFASELILNDADPRIFAFWRAVLNQTEELVRRVRTAPITIRKWRQCRAIYDSGVSRQSQLDVAFSTFFLNRCNRSGILMDGGPIGGYDQGGKWKLDARFNREDLVARIRRVASYRDRIKVTRMDARKLLSGLCCKDDRLLVYLDPPYYHKGQRLYLNSLDHKDHQGLARLLSKDPPFRWVLTYDNVEAIREMYASFAPQPVELSYSAYRRGLGRELIIFDPRLKIPNELLRENHRPGRLQFSQFG
jgi:DNA adenine methylase